MLCIVRISYLQKDRTGPKYHLNGLSRFLKLVSVLTSLACLLVVLFQFNARLAADPNPLLDGKIAPFEWARKSFQISTPFCDQIVTRISV